MNAYFYLRKNSSLDIGGLVRKSNETLFEPGAVTGKRDEI